MSWASWIRGEGEIEPSLYAADFNRLGAQIEELLRSGCRIFHFDVGDGHFVPPVTIGPVVLRSIAPAIHAADGVIDCHLMVADPGHHLPEFAESGADSVTFHVEATDDPAGVGAAARALGLAVGVAFNPETEVSRALDFAEAAGAELILCMSIVPGYSGQPFMPGAYERIEALASLAAVPIQVDGGVGESNAAAVRGAGARLLVAGNAIFADPDPGRSLRPPRHRRGMSLDRALALAAAAAGAGYPNPTVGAVVVAGGEVVGEGVTERSGGRHGEVVALEAAGAAARGATLFVTMEPCAHHGRTPPCVDAISAAGIARVVAGCRDPNPEAAGGLERLRAAGVEAEIEDRFEARRQNEAWRTWKALGRPFVTYKAATTVDGRVTVPGRRWLTGEGSRRRVHELRAATDAVAVGMGTVRADAPRLDAREVPVVRQPRRLAFGRGPLPPESGLELRSGPLADELAALAAEGVQSLLLEGGPTLATAFVAAGLVDKLLVFVAPTLSGTGQQFLGDLGEPVPLLHLSSTPFGADVLLEAYLREP